ncbi:MAG: DUF427 domain-containing protein [Bacteroidota bacterium]
MASSSKGKKQDEVPKWLREARAKWEYTGKVRPPFAKVPQAGQRSVWDFPRPPALERESREIVVKHSGSTLATTTSALAVLETASPPTYYIPPEDVNRKLLVKVPKQASLCEWKGNAEYWALKTESAYPIAWSYANPFPPFEKLTDYLAFYPQKLECYLNQERVIPQPGAFYAGWITHDLSGPFKGEPGSGHW